VTVLEDGVTVRTVRTVVSALNRLESVPWRLG
jgi:hypothetical protein